MRCPRGALLSLLPKCPPGESRLTKEKTKNKKTAWPRGPHSSILLTHPTLRRGWLLYLHLLSRSRTARRRTGVPGAHGLRPGQTDGIPWPGFGPGFEPAWGPSRSFFGLWSTVELGLRLPPPARVLQQVRVCGIKYMIQLHPTRMRYCRCFLFPPLTPPCSCSHPAFFRKAVRSRAVRAGQLNLLSPIVPEQNKQKQKSTSPWRTNIHPATSLWASSPPTSTTSPSCSSSPTPASPSSSISRGGIVTICPTPVFLRKDRTAFYIVRGGLMGPGPVPGPPQALTGTGGGPGSHHWVSLVSSSASEAS